jgi:hypothetical protein
VAHGRMVSHGEYRAGDRSELHVDPPDPVGDDHRSRRCWTKDEGGVHWMVKFVLNDGSSVPSTATSGHPREVEALERLVQRHGVVVRFDAE